MILLIDIASYF